MKKIIWLILTATFIANYILAQGTVEMADSMRENGKIYVVVAVACVVFAVITIYLVTIDRKLSRLEKKLKKN